MQIVVRYLVLALIAFATHFAWESLHLPLYKEYDALGTGWKLSLWATVGDVLYTALIVAVVGMIRRDVAWIRQPQYSALWYSATAGFLIALFVEYKALYLHRWAYAAAMPLIPFLGVGVSPVLQMTILTPLVILIASKFTLFDK